MEEMNNEREFFTLTDAETGKEAEFELVGVTEYKDNTYYAMIPADAADKAAEDENFFCEYVILRLVKQEDGTYDLVSVDDEEEEDNVADLFDDMFSEEIDYDGEA